MRWKIESYISNKNIYNPKAVTHSDQIPCDINDADRVNGEFDFTTNSSLTINSIHSQTVKNVL